MKVLKTFLIGYIKKVLPISVLIILATALILFLIKLFSLYNLINIVSIEAVIFFILSFATSSVFSRSERIWAKKTLSPTPDTFGSKVMRKEWEEKISFSAICGYTGITLLVLSLVIYFVFK